MKNRKRKKKKKELDLSEYVVEEELYLILKEHL